MYLKVEKNQENKTKRKKSKEWLVNTGPEVVLLIRLGLSDNNFHAQQNRENGDKKRMKKRQK